MRNTETRAQSKAIVLKPKKGAMLIFTTNFKPSKGIKGYYRVYVLIFPGKISQYTNQIDAFGLDTDQKRLMRLFFQSLLILLALWSTGAIKAYVQKRFNKS